MNIRGVRCLLVVLVLGAVATAQISDKVMIRGARIIPVVGDELAEGSILIEGGKITAIGKDLKPAFDVKVIDGKGKVLFPGMVDPMSSSGLDVANERLDVAPFLHVFDAINPGDRYFEEALRQGITSIHVSQGNSCVIGAVSRIVRPIGIRVSDMTVRPDGGLKISFFPKGGYDHAVQSAVLRGAFTELDRYLDTLAEKLYEEKLEKDEEPISVGPKEARKRGRELIKADKIDDKHRNLWRLRQGKLDAYIYCGAAMDVTPALAFIEKEGLKDRVGLLLGSECFKTADRLKGLARPVILSASNLVHRERNRMTDEDEDTFVPAVLLDKKIPFSIGGTSTPWRDAGRCVRNGVPRQAALEAITINAARSIGLGHRVGSLEVGKDANILVLSGDPLDESSWVEHVFIEGRHVYEITKDKRMRDLLQGLYDSKKIEKKKAEAAKKAAEGKSDDKKAKSGKKD